MRHEVGELLRVRDGYRIGWYDHPKTIMLAEFFGAWTWEDAIEDTKMNTACIKQQPHFVYSILVFHDESPFLPTSGSALRNLRKVWEYEAENERYILIVGLPENTMFGRFLRMMMRIYSGQWSFGKMIFVSDLQAALAFIEKDKRLMTS